MDSRVGGHRRSRPTNPIPKGGRCGEMTGHEPAAKALLIATPFPYLFVPTGMPPPVPRAGQPRHEGRHRQADDGDLPPQRRRARGIAHGRDPDVARITGPVQAVQVIEHLRLDPATVLPPAARARFRRRPSCNLGFPPIRFLLVVLLQSFAQQPHVD